MIFDITQIITCICLHKLFGTLAEYYGIVLLAGSGTYRQIHDILPSNLVVVRVCRKSSLALCFCKPNRERDIYNDVPYILEMASSTADCFVATLPLLKLKRLMLGRLRIEPSSSPRRTDLLCQLTSLFKCVIHAKC